MDYAGLVEAIQSTVENEFETEDINRFISFAESRIYNTVRLPALRKTDSSVNTVNGTSTITLPNDYLAPFSVAVVSSGTYYYLLNKDPDFIREAYPTVGATGLPVHYAQPDKTSLIFGPTPAATYQVVINYFYYPESIVTATNTWLGDNYAFVLLAACLIEAAKFLKSEQDTIDLYTKEYAQAISLLINFGDGRLNQDEYRSGAPRTQAV